MIKNLDVEPRKARQGSLEYWSIGVLEWRGLPNQSGGRSFAGMTVIEEIERTVLGLPVEQRAHLAESLLDSLPPLSNLWSESDELAEVERREREIDSGQVHPLPEAEFWRRVEASRKR